MDQETGCALAGLIAEVGTDSFTDGVMDVFHALCGADMCSGFAIRAGEPEVLFARSRDPSRSAFARIASLRYAQTYWKRDTAAASTLGRAHRNVKTIRRPASTIRDLDYRHECYGSGQVVERVSLCKAGPVQIIANAYRERNSGSFSLNEIERFEAAAPMIVAAIEKHLQLGNVAAANAPDGSPSSMQQCLKDYVIAKLSLREAQVLALLAAGADQKAIAEELGIATSSVVTYRRRGYIKMGVNSRWELRKRLQAPMGKQPPTAAKLL